MSEIIIEQMPRFKKAYKKMHTNERLAVDEAIEAIVANPYAGEEKKGTLAGVFVYKFKFNTKLLLLAYEWDPERRSLVAVESMKIFTEI